MPWCKLCVLSLAVMLANVSAEVVHGGQNVVVVLDDSGSMNEAMGWNASLRRIDAAKQALQTVMEQLPDDARIGILALNRQGADGAWLMPLGPLDRGRLRQAVVQLDADGGTPLGASLKTATDALLELRSRQPYGDFRLLIVTDGEAQDSELVDRYLPQIQQRGITIDVIGVSMAQDHSLATRVDRYRRADDTESLQEAL
jgi:Mg-chelatase subunit ChlD